MTEEKLVHVFVEGKEKPVLVTAASATKSVKEVTSRFGPDCELQARGQVRSYTSSDIVPPGDYNLIRPASGVSPASICQLSIPLLPLRFVLLFLRDLAVRAFNPFLLVRL